MGEAGKRLAAALGLLAFLGSLAGCGRGEMENIVVFEKTESIPSQVDTSPLEFPYLLPDSGLVAEEMISYDGPYWEDGSGETVENVAALMLYNPGDRMVEFAAISVKRGNKQHYFFVYRLPPNSRCLVLERNRLPYEDGGITVCRDLRIQWEYQELAREQLNYIGFGKKLTVVNRESRLREHIVLWYKRYVQEGGYYLGGVAYSVHLSQLQPKESRVLTPDNYDAANARVVSIRMEE